MVLDRSEVRRICENSNSKVAKIAENAENAENLCRACDCVVTTAIGAGRNHAAEKRTG